MADVSDPRVVAALGAAVKQIEAAIADTEKGVNRILGLVELLMERADKDSFLKLEGIMEACAFQDLTGQKLRKVERLLEHLQTKTVIKVPGAVDFTKAQATRAEKDVQPAATSAGLSQEEVDRLLKGM